jgi:hypothetical protein
MAHSREATRQRRRYCCQRKGVRGGRVAPISGIVCAWNRPKNIKRFRKLSGHHHPKRLQSRRGPRNFAADAHGMDGGQRRANERTSRKDLGVLKRRKQSTIRFAPLVRRNDIRALLLLPGCFDFTLDVRLDPGHFRIHLRRPGTGLLRAKTVSQSGG